MRATATASKNLRLQRADLLQDEAAVLYSIDRGSLSYQTRLNTGEKVDASRAFVRPHRG
jgi:hypothetical protein